MIDLIAKNNNGSLWIVPKKRKNMSVFEKQRAQRAADRLNEVLCQSPSHPEPSLLSDKEMRARYDRGEIKDRGLRYLSLT